MLDEDIVPLLNTFTHNQDFAEFLMSSVNLYYTSDIKATIQNVLNDLHRKYKLAELNLYSRPVTKASRYVRNRGVIVEDIIKAYAYKSAESSLGTHGLTDLNFKNANEDFVRFYEIKTKDFYADNVGVNVPLSDFRKIDDHISKNVYVMVVEFIPATNNIKEIYTQMIWSDRMTDNVLSTVFNPNNIPIIYNHYYQELGVRLINKQVFSNDTWLIQYKNGNLHSVGGSRIFRTELEYTYLEV